MNLIGSVIIIALMFCKTLSSQITVSAWVDKKTAPINQSITLTISVSGENIGSIKPDIPTLSDFNIYSSGKSSNISIVNGQIYTTIEFYYTLVPKRTGRFIIPKIGIFTGKEKYFTKEIEVEITSPSIQSQPTTQPNQKKYQQASPQQMRNIDRDELVFVKATVDKKTAYIGEQITLSIKFYTALPIASNPEYYPPKYSNLISEELPPIRSGTEIINGIRYYFAETKTALFGIMPGKATISSAQIIAPIQQEVSFDPFDPNFIQKFFSQMSQTQNVTLETKPITIEILDLPHQPKDFSGAVGNFFITAKVDNTTIHAGEPINITVEISGKGNVKPINPPQISNPSLKIYDIVSSETISKNNDVVGGTKKFTYIATPLNPGVITIEGIKFTFFNIDTKQYETITTNPIKINVLKPKEGKSFDFGKPMKNTIDQKSQDIEYIYEKIPKTILPQITKKLGSVRFNIEFILLAILITISLIKNTINNRDINTETKAYSILEKRIKKSIKNKDSKTLSVIYDSIYDYLSSKLKENLAHLSFNKIKNLIKEKNASISDEILNQLEEIINKIEFLNFTKTNVSNEEIEIIAQKTLSVIKNLEKEMKK